MIILYILSGIILLMGLAIKVFQWDFLIAGFNTMSRAQKERVDREGLCRTTGNFLIIIALLLAAGGIVMHLNLRLLGLILMMAIIPLTIVFILQAQKYDHNKKDKSEIKIVIGVLIFIILLSILILLPGAQGIKVEVDADRINIKGAYGTNINMEEITQIQLEQRIPKIEGKVNGFDLGFILRGHFTLDGMGQGRIYIHENKAPFILIRTSKDFFIINYRDPEKTKELYEHILQLYR